MLLIVVSKLNMKKEIPGKQDVKGYCLLKSFYNIIVIYHILFVKIVLILFSIPLIPHILIMRAAEG